MTAGGAGNAHVEVVGVDACRKGWLAVRLVDGRFRDARLCGLLEEAAAESGPKVVSVDIPLGLTDEGWRECDLCVPALLGPRAHSVFRIPPRAVVEAADYTAANALCRKMLGGGLARQAHALFPKILKADRIRRSGADHLYEVHPELSFRTMAGAPLRSAKRTWNVQEHRRALLAEKGVGASRRPGRVRGGGRRRRPGRRRGGLERVPHRRGPGAVLSHTRADRRLR
nr:DUF429 domain-containing protein [Nocardiopsis sp. FR6]